MASLIPLEINPALAADTNLQPFGKSIDYGSSYAVQTSGHLVSSTAELSACMKHGKDHLHRRNAGLVIDSHRNAASIVSNCNRIILLNRHVNIFAEACQGLIHGIVYNLINQMMKSTGGGASNVHTRSLPDCFQSFQNLDLICSVFCAHFQSSYCLF